MIKKRNFFRQIDKCYEEYSITECPFYKKVMIGDYTCSKCKHCANIDEMNRVVSCTHK